MIDEEELKDKDLEELREIREGLEQKLREA